MTTARKIVEPNESRARRAEQAGIDRKREANSRQNRGFVQVYQMGWRRLQTLMKTHTNAARLYALLAEHLDETGCVVASQKALAQMMGVSEKTIQRHSAILEDVKALVRIPLAGGVYAYALDPEEVWRAYDSGKEYAAFYSKTLVHVRGRNAAIIKRKLRVMIHEQNGQTELPLEAEGDAPNV